MIDELTQTQLALEAARADANEARQLAEDIRADAADLRRQRDEMLEAVEQALRLRMSERVRLILSATRSYCVDLTEIERAKAEAEDAINPYLLSGDELARAEARARGGQI